MSLPACWFVLLGVGRTHPRRYYTLHLVDYYNIGNKLLILMNKFLHFLVATTLLERHNWRNRHESVAAEKPECCGLPSTNVLQTIKVQQDNVLTEAVFQQLQQVVRPSHASLIIQLLAQRIHRSASYTCI